MAISTPEAEPIPKATMPTQRMPSVCRFMNEEAVAVAPTVRPRQMTTMLFSSFCAALLKRSTTPLSFIRLPSIRHPIRVPAEGTIKETIIATMMGKRIFSFFDTVRSCFMRIMRSFLVVSARMMGGCITGTKAM